MNPVVRIFLVFAWSAGVAFAQAPGTGILPRREAVRSVLTHPQHNVSPSVDGSRQTSRRLSVTERAQIREQVRQHGYPQRRESHREPG